MEPIVVSHMRLLLAMVVEDLVASVIKLMPLRHPFQTSHPDLVETTTTIVHLVSSLQRANVEMVPTASFLTIAVVAEVLVDLAIKIQRLGEALDRLLLQVHSAVGRLLLRRRVHSVEAEQHLLLARLVVEEGLHRHLPLVHSEEEDWRQLQVHSEEVERHLEEGQQHLTLVLLEEVELHLEVEQLQHQVHLVEVEQHLLLVLLGVDLVVALLLLPLLDLCRIVILHSADLDDNDKKLLFTEEVVVGRYAWQISN